MAFYGRAGNAIMKSLKRLSIDPLAVYGTLCVKCPVLDPAMADPACVASLTEELAIIQPQDRGGHGGGCAGGGPGPRRAPPPRA